MRDRFEEQHEFPPPWFSNEDDPEPTPVDSTIWRSLIGIGVIVIVAVLLLIPVLQAEILQRRRNSLPDAAVERTALQFSSAILFGRSEGQAMIFSNDRSRDEVRGVLTIMVARPQPSNQARLQLFSVPCRERSADRCFAGRLIDPSNPLSSGIRFGLDGSDDGPKVVWVELDEISVLSERDFQAL